MKILHIILALNVFLSSTGITVFSHICSAKGTSLEFFTQSGHCCSKKKEKKSCCSKSKKSKSKEHKGLSWNAKPCCSNDVDFVQVDLESTVVQAKSVKEYDFGFHILNNPFGSSQIILAPSNYKTNCFALYNSPPDERDIITFVQSYRC